MYFFLNRWRTISAIVFTKNVNKNRSTAETNKTLYKVPWYGASGISTAMFADRVLNPLKGLKLRIGVLPVAIKTIIVSPTALPKPIIIAENIPGLAVGKTTRIEVCHLVAPRASEAEVRCCGTLDNASSQIVKMIGMTANPIAKPTTILFR